MSSRLWRLPIALMLLIASSVAVNLATPSAYAYPTTTTIAWPTGLQLNQLSSYSPFTAHADGSLSIGTPWCNASNTPTEVTISSDHSQSSVVTTGDGSTYYCASELVGGVDQTVYYVSTSSADNSQKIVARNGQTILWAYSIGSVTCYGHPRYFAAKALTLGYDGNLYFLRQNTCSGGYQLASLTAGTGELRFTPSSTPVSIGYVLSLLPYEGGIGVIGDDARVYYYSYTGVVGVASTFAPSVPSGTTSTNAGVTSDGRVYLVASHYDGTTNSTIKTVYYRDLTSSTIYTVSPPSGVSWNSSYLYVTPSDGVVLAWSASGNQVFGYFDDTGALVYSHSFSVNTSTLGITVDSAGNVLLQRTITLPDNDQDVIIESYDPTGTETDIFDAVQEFGTSGRDVYTSMSSNSGYGNALGGGQYYLILCYRTTSTGSSYPTCNPTTDNPQIISISVAGSDYPRSGIFSGLNDGPSYVALGDSYASGEANPPFMEGTDNNGGDGCDRSFNAYPVQLAAYEGLRLNGFKACSGAETSDVTATFKGEPAQTDTLTSDTGMVTITIGGNDVDFKDFATLCVVGPGACDSSSAEYQYSASVIVNTLPGNLETLFDAIATAAPNAQVYVVGYPYVTPAVGTSCTDFTNSEEQAAKDIVDGLNVDLYNAVIHEGSDFHFVNPTLTGSPFLGNELCTATPYFTGVSTPLVFSFHPNAAGVAAYEELIASYI